MINYQNRFYGRVICDELFIVDSLANGRKFMMGKMLEACTNQKLSFVAFCLDIPVPLVHECASYDEDLLRDNLSNLGRLLLGDVDELLEGLTESEKIRLSGWFSVANEKSHRFSVSRFYHEVILDALKERDLISKNGEIPPSLGGMYIKG